MSNKVEANIDSWKKRLLDINKRNRLINFKVNKTSSLEIIYPTFFNIFNFIEENEVRIAELFSNEHDDYFETDLALLTQYSGKEYTTCQGVKLIKQEKYPYSDLEDPINTFLAKNKKKNFVFTNYDRWFQKRTCSNLLKRSNLFKEENAVNILYIAVGFLTWYETNDSKESIRSPLILIPVELSQQNFDAPYIINFVESELLLNSSLLKYMETTFKMDFNFDIKEKDPLTSYINYKEYLQTLITDKRWKIDDSIFLDIFSFSKLNMVNDLEQNYEQVLNSKFIQALSGINSLEASGKNIKEEDIDKYINPVDFHQVLDADFSQEIAIQSAINGKSFVLQGPPGTGKSQTITNIISELLARNKKILFVAEKKAAMDVVYHNLKKSKISEFALPLHDSKASKKDLVVELDALLNIRQSIESVPIEYLLSIQKSYLSSKKVLQEYSELLLEKQGTLNKSLFELFNTYYEYTNYHDLSFTFNRFALLDENGLFEVLNTIKEFETSLALNNFKITENIWYGTKRTKNSLSEKEQILGILKSSQNALEELDAFIQENEYIKLRGKYTLNTLSHVEKLFEHFTKILPIESDLIEEFQDKSYSTKFNSDILLLVKLKKLLQKNESLQAGILKVYEENIFNLDIPETLKELKQYSNFIKRIFSTKYKILRLELMQIQKKPKKAYFELLMYLTQANQYLENNKAIEDLKEQISLKVITIGDSLRVQENIDKVTWLNTYFELIKNIPLADSNTFNSLRKVHDSLTDIKIKQKKYTNLYKKALKSVEDVQNQFEPSKRVFAPKSITSLINEFQSMEYDQTSLTNYSYYVQAYEKGVNDGLFNFYDLLLKENIKTQFKEIFLKRFYLLNIDNVLNKDERLQSFKKSLFDETKKSFVDNDKKLIDLASSKIKKVIFDSTPNIVGLEAINSDIIFLRREAQKKRNIKPIREIFSAIPNLILTLKPVLMMSPLSVSTFLKSSNFKFDVLIIDEASQVRPENAIGAIYRAKQVIIVGDKEQLPPTNFFETVDDSDYDEFDANSFDSILDLTSSALVPISLKWHYRSKFEELMYISNQEIYTDLITFPARKKASYDEGVEFYKVDGIYENKMNLKEAEKVAELVFKHFDNYGSTKSLGVVCFSESQQKAVETAIAKIRRKNTNYESFFNYNIPDPFFIKNIETVQGDERDVIIISVCYGYDKEHKIAMRFGPLNNDGGYRRLNVMITRAKENVKLVASIDSSDIDLGKTEARGVKLLKEYLKYAEANSNIDASINNSTNIEFINMVYNELTNIGYKVIKNVGNSSYKIDLGILHPDYADTYILGIECDGSTYTMSKVIRDRERLRQEVLENRGWNIYRLWSVSWFNNPTESLNDLINKIQDALDNFNTNQSNKKEFIEESIPTNLIQKQESFDFPDYPNYHLTFKNKSLLEGIIELSPIHIDLLKKLIPPLYGRVVYSSYVDTEFRLDMRGLKKEKIELVGDFVINFKQPIIFREVLDSESRRELDHIHLDEISDAMKKILQVVKSVKRLDLFKKIMGYCGYNSLSQKGNELCSKVLDQLLILKIARLEDDFVKLN
jgi:superfamily I DNA and/or RNA helicase